MEQELNSDLRLLPWQIELIKEAERRGIKRLTSSQMREILAELYPEVKLLPSGSK